MKTTEPTIGRQPLTGWASRLPTATLDLRGRHEKPTLAQKVESIRRKENLELLIDLESIAWFPGGETGLIVGKYEGFRVG